MTTVATKKPQHLIALERADEVRLARAALKREIGKLPRIEGKRALADLIEFTEDDRYLGAKVGYLLTAPHRVGPSWAKKLLSRLQIPPSKRLAELSGRQRTMLAFALRQDWADLCVVERDGFVVVA